MPTGDVETYHEQGEWKNKIEGERHAVARYGGRDEAVVEGRKLAIELKVEHIIKRVDGTIGERNSYGHDPRNIEG